MKLYQDTDRELTFDDYKQLPPLRGLSVAELRELYDNVQNAVENAWNNGADMLQIALMMDAEKVNLYLKMYEKRAARNV